MTGLSKRQELHLKEFKRFPTYENFLGAREAGIDTMELLEMVPRRKHDYYLKMAAKFGLEDCDFREPKDYGDPDAAKTF